MGVAETFASLASSLDYSMLIVTAASGADRGGCLVGFATQCSIDPPRFLVCVSLANHTYRLAMDSDALGVHLPSARDDALVRLFGGETEDEVDKLARCRWHDGPRGVPILEDCPRWFVGEILLRQDLGDHTGFLLAPVAAHDEDGDADGFPFARAQSIEPGHAP